jgi:hypothetical protein
MAGVLRRHEQTLDGLAHPVVVDRRPAHNPR